MVAALVYASLPGLWLSPVQFLCSVALCRRRVAELRFAERAPRLQSSSRVGLRGVSAWHVPLGARDIFGRAAGILAAAAYAFATFRFRELYVEGNYAQFLAWALYPFAFYFFRCLAARPTRTAFLGAVLSLAGVLLAHNISAMLFAPFFLVYVVYELGSRGQARAWLVVALAAFCALGLGLIFWLPALGEASFTRVRVLTAGFFDVAANFLRPQELLAASSPLDYRAANPVLPFNFGRVHLALALLGALTVLRKGAAGGERGRLVLACGSLLVAGLMMLPLSLPVWRTVPFLAFAEFPSRFYGIALVFSSLLAGAALRWVPESNRWQLPVATAAVITLILSVGVYQFPRPFLPVSDPGVGGLLTYERTQGKLGTTSASEYLGQLTVQKPETPAVSPDQPRLALVGVPAGVVAEVDAATTNSLELRLQSQVTAQVAVAQFYFPGWQGWLDGEPLALGPCRAEGLICFSVPDGEHRVRLAYGGTPLQRGASLASLGALLATALVALVLGRPKIGDAQPAPAGWPGSLALSALLLGLLGVKVAWVEPHTSWFRVDSPPDIVLPASHRADVVLGDQVRLIGYDIDRTTVRQGAELHVRLYWQALQPLPQSYASFVELRAGPTQAAFARSDAQNPGDVPTTSWNADFYIIDDHTIPIPAGVPPVAYKLNAGLYLAGSDERLADWEAPEIVHVLPEKPMALGGQTVARFDEDIRVPGYRIATEDGALALTLYWQADAPLAGDYQVFVHVLDGAGQILAQGDGPPASGLYPSSRWLPGQVIPDERRISLPAGSCATRVLIGLYDIRTSARLPATGIDGTVWPDDAVVLPLPACLANH